MRIFILEDELKAQRKLEKLIQQYFPNSTVVGTACSITEALQWLNSNKLPDLWFSDIELLDGNAFQLYEQHPIACPIIFATAYDQFLLKAFQANGIAYLLKPYDEDQFKSAVEKYQRLFSTTPTQPFMNEDVLQELKQALQPTFAQYRTRFVIKRAAGITLVPCQEVEMIKSEDNLVMAYTNKNKRHPLNMTLNELEEQLDPSTFFRLSRSTIVNINAITKIEPHFNDRLAVTLEHIRDRPLTSAGRTSSFRKWLDR